MFDSTSLSETNKGPTVSSPHPKSSFSSVSVAQSQAQTSSKLSLLYDIPSEHGLTAQKPPSIHFYPRLSLSWPFLVSTIPPQPGLSKTVNIRLYKLTHLPSSISCPAVTLTNPPIDHALDDAVVCCITLDRTYSEHGGGTLHLFTGSTNGDVRKWDLHAGKLVNQIKAADICANLLRCIAVRKYQQDSADNNDILLTGGARGVIGLWDLRVPGPGRPQQTFRHSGQPYSVVSEL
ncbi:unnamed protein product [Echinostoma caproni]|uniref:WD_REPEATS_REGION domain-containing protein n=1 Tax=Echinostoma caproni TaxID=27848 RepID=A0A183ABY9_9TREM|nr:unnamed protein product [Echinostoma caproni]